MNEFLIDCSFKQYSMALKFDLLIQRYAILKKTEGRKSRDTVPLKIRGLLRINQLMAVADHLLGKHTFFTNDTIYCHQI
jgi:hypothetical protein